MFFSIKEIFLRKKFFYFLFFLYLVNDLFTAKAIVHDGVLAILVLDKIVIIKLPIAQIDNAVHGHVEDFQIGAKLGDGDHVDLEQLVADEHELAERATLPGEKHERIGIGVGAQRVVIAQRGLSDGIDHDQRLQCVGEIVAEKVQQLGRERLAKVHAQLFQRHLRAQGVLVFARRLFHDQKVNTDSQVFISIGRQRPGLVTAAAAAIIHTDDARS
jgi:hypothetical protein